MTVSSDSIKRKKVAHALSNFNIGGTEMVVSMLANSLHDIGYESEVIVAQRTGPIEKKFSPDVNIVSYPWDDTQKKWNNRVDILTRYFREHDPDVVLAHDIMIGTAQVAHKRAHSRSKLIVVNHGCDSPRGLLYTITRFSPHTWMEYASRGQASAAVGVSEGMTRNMLVEYASQIRHTIYNPVITPDRRAMLNEELEHRWLKGPGKNSVPVIVTVARLDVRQKAQDVLLRAFKRVVSNMEARLVIVGGGDDRAMLERMIDGLGLNDIVELAGARSNPFKYMKAADLFVFPSNREALGNVLIEAMFCGTPVVSTDCPYGPSEILEDGRYGELVPVGDEDALAAAVVRALKSPPSDERRAELRARAEQFDDKTAARRYAELIEELTAGER